MNAKKCDRCGEFFIPIEFPDFSDTRAFYVTHPKNIFRHKHDIDMCDKCLNVFWAWWTNAEPELKEADRES